MYFDIKPDKVQFEYICDLIDKGIPLNLNMIHDVFGKPFFELMILCLCDSRKDIINLIAKDKL